MALTSPLKQFYIKPMPGMNSKMETLELEGNYCELARNLRYEVEPGAVVKRDPISFYNTTSSGTGAVMGLYRFYRADGTIVSVKVHGTNIYVGNDAAGTWAALTLPAGMSLTENKRMAFRTYQGLLIMGNAFDNMMVYDGSSSDKVVWELGSCKCIAGTGAGAITRTNISYQVTMDNDAYICGAVSNEIASVTAKDIELSNIPLGPAGTANRKIYRKSSETGGVYRLVTTIANNYATTYTDTNNDVSGAGAIGAVTDDMPKGNLLQINRERFFLSGDPDNPNKVYYSNPYIPGYIQQTTNLDYMEIDPDDGDEIIGIPIAMGTMSIMKRNTIRKAHISFASGNWDSGGGFNLQSGGPESWYVDDPLVFTGPVAPWSVLQTQVGVLFLGWNHWYQFDGATLTPIVDEFDVSEILSSSYTDVVAHYSKGVLMFSYANATDGNDYHDRVARYNFFRQKLSIDTFTRYTAATGVTKNTGINCFASYDGDDEMGDVYYGDSRDGFVYRAEDTPLWIRWNKKSQLQDSTLDDIYIGGTQDSPWFEVGWDLTIDELLSTNLTPTAAEDAYDAGTTYHDGDVVLYLGSKYVCILESTGNLPTDVTYWTLTADAVSIDKLPGVIDRSDTDGTITFNSMQINAGSLINLYWNMRKHDDDDEVKFQIRTGATQVDCEAAAWYPATPNEWKNTPADMADATADIWFQMRVVMECVSTAGSPRVYFSDGYVIKFNYRVGGSVAENAVEFIYDTGWRNFNEPFVDKIWKKIGVWLEATAGTLEVDWWTENSNGSFTIDLTTYTSRWESFLPSTAMGRELKLRLYKNDVEDLMVKEFKGLYTPEPIIV